MFYTTLRIQKSNTEPGNAVPTELLLMHGKNKVVSYKWTNTQITRNKDIIQIKTGDLLSRNPSALNIDYVKNRCKSAKIKSIRNHENETYMLKSCIFHEIQPDHHVTAYGIKTDDEPIEKE